MPDVEGMTWAVGMMDCEHMGLKEELSVKQQKSSVLSEQDVPKAVSPLSAVLGLLSVLRWHFCESIGVCHSVSQ